MHLLKQDQMDHVVPSQSNELPKGFSSQVPFNNPVLDPEFFELLPLFFSQSLESLDRLKRYLHDRNWIESARCAHRIKGSAATYGFFEFAHEIELLERQLLQNPEDIHYGEVPIDSWICDIQLALKNSPGMPH